MDFVSYTDNIDGILSSKRQQWSIASKYQDSRKWWSVMDNASVVLPVKLVHSFLIQYFATCDKNRKQPKNFFWLVERVIYFIIHTSILFLPIFIYAFDDPFFLLCLHSLPLPVSSWPVRNVCRGQEQGLWCQAVWIWTLALPLMPWVASCWFLHLSQSPFSFENLWLVILIEPTS